MFDICIVGAGMAGITAAIEASKLGLSVALIDKNRKIGNKIYATGNGKCNLSNRYMNFAKCYHSADDAYADFIKNMYSNPSYKSMLKEYFSYIGLRTYTDKYGYIYPASNQASCVVWAMNDRLSTNKVHILTDSAVLNIEKNEDIFSIILDNGETLSSKYAILACGGNSYPKLGGSVQGYELARKMGHHIARLSPALCAVVTKDNLCIADGVRVRTTAYLTVDNNICCSHTGEVQITSYGLSGIAIFNMASRITSAIEQGKSVTVSMNLLENIISDKSEITSLTDDICSYKDRTIMCALNGITHEKLALYTLNKNNISPKIKIGELTPKSVYKLIYDLYDYSCDIMDTKGYDMAQVTSGGVYINEINSDSCESKLKKNLYIVGEMLDIDGICGGYNLTFAIISALKAAKSIYDKNKSN